MAKCGTLSLGLAAVAAVLVAVGLFSLYEGVQKISARSAETVGGIENTVGNFEDESPALVPSNGPLYLQIGINGTEDCDAVFDALTITFIARTCPDPVPSWCDTAANFDLADFGSSVPAGGEMALVKDCMPGSVGGVYSGVTMVGSMIYTPVCETNCEQYIFADFSAAQYRASVAYKIESPLVGVAGIAFYNIGLTRDTLGAVWETAGNDITWFLIWAVVGCVVGGGACFVMEDESGEMEQELA